MADVLLLHGAWCGAWIWEPLVATLASRGVVAAAPELPAEDGRADVEAYVGVALATLAPDDRPLVVGHSLAGLLLEPLAARQPVAGLVYLAAFVPEPGLSLRDCWRRHGRQMFVPGWDRGTEARPGDVSAWSDLEAAVATLFGRAEPGVAREAAAQLRPQAWHLTNSTFVGSLATPSHCLLASEDRLLAPEWSAADAAARLGVFPHVLAGADHCPMLSQPAELAEHLVGLL
jgi:pimeloyl-ACP methyl ester carboxylesterase